MRNIVLVVTLLCAAPALAQHPDHTDIVTQAKADLASVGTDFKDCGGFQIVLLAAWRLKGEGAGLLDKPNGSHCEWPLNSSNFYASDIIAYPDGHHYDVLGSSGELNIPAWQDDGLIDTARWRPPISPIAITPAPAPDGVLSRVTTIEGVVADIRQQLLEHETAEAAERVAAADFRKQVGIQWSHVTAFIAKYGAIIAGSVLGGKLAGL